MKVTEADLGVFAVYNIWIGKKTPTPYVRLQFAPRCGNCKTLTDGVEMLGFDFRLPRDAPTPPW